MSAYARVAVARPFPEPLTYGVPPFLLDDLRPGQAVLVPIGPVGETGYVLELTDEPGCDPAKVKPITRLIDPEPVFDAKQLVFFRWIADYYLAPLGMVIHTALPREISARVVRVLVPTEAAIEALSAGGLGDLDGLLLREVVARPGLTRKGIVRRLAEEAEEAALGRGIEALVKGGFLEWADREIEEGHGHIRTVTLAADPDAALATIGGRATRQRAIVEALRAGPRDLRDLLAEQGESASGVMRVLEQRGILRFGVREDRDPRATAHAGGAATAPPLHPDQRAALDAIAAGNEGTFLLWGVTGSGKTEVFLGAAELALGRGRQVLVLVPEIGLTPQLVGRFKARFGEGVAVLHSALTGSERLAEWRRIRAGEAQVAVGARSALFAPFRDLGLLVVDEEHDDSYKQDDGVRYNARDLAVVLARHHRCPVVLASATPSLESWYNARSGRYTLLRLPERATPRPVPRVTVVDLESLEGDERPLFAPIVVAGMSRALDANGKVIVLYNRRGYATIVQCQSCGGTYECKNCGITLTLHRGARVLACHYCGLKRSYNGQCPACHRETLDELGKGTEKISEELERLFPGVPIGRMDADTTAIRGSHHRILEDFRLSRTRILVGTQIVSKGHDFPDVHVAVVVSADHGLRIPDFRSAERTYALLVQTAGRAGRGDVPGEVYVQTWAPEHYALKMLDDPDAFYEAEMRIRRTLRYPPGHRLVLLRLDGVDRRAVQDQAETLAASLRDDAGRMGVEILGPAPAALPRLVGRWRFQIVLRAADARVLRAWLDRHRDLPYRTKHSVRLTVDVDPRHLM